jgi:hypothetical protein
VIVLYIFLAGLLVAGAIAGLFAVRSLGWRHWWQQTLGVMLGCVFGIAALLLVFVAALLGVRLLDKRSPLANK